MEEMIGSMKYQIFSENEWLYPDTEIIAKNKVDLYVARNSDSCFQILTDVDLQGGEEISYSLNISGCTPELMQLLPIYVEENTGLEWWCTKNYDEVKHFVTRKAPFEVYDVTKPVEDGETEKGRGAFFVRVNIEKNAPVGNFDGIFNLNIGVDKLEIPISIKIYNTIVPSYEESKFHMTNWLFRYQEMAKKGNDALMEFLDKHFRVLLDMRNDTIMIPSGEPVYDENGSIIDFDFSLAETVGNFAIEKGFKYIMGGFVAHWKDVDDENIFLLWDQEIEARSLEAFRQFKIYFTRAYECVKRNNWDGRYMQCIEDEPTPANIDAYRTITNICRRCMPGVIINDPMSKTEAYGSVDIWVIKQEDFDIYTDRYKKMQEMGEELWVYTCGFPAGPVMKRGLDFPISVSRLPLWMTYFYGGKGYLHWGYNARNPERCRPEIPYITESEDVPGHRLPPGDAFIVYPGNKSIWYGVRGHAQRMGVYDFELLTMLGKKDKDKAIEIITSVCRSFIDYDSSAEAIDGARKKILDQLG